jgi:magnesium-transporting ATPase (P-type)
LRTSFGVTGAMAVVLTAVALRPHHRQPAFVNSVAATRVAAVLALVADLQMPGEGMATLAVAIVGVIVINGLFSFWQEYRAEETMAALQRLLPHQVRAQRDGAVIIIPADDLVPGDVIVFSAGDNVPADCRLLEAFGVRVNNATVTGEARPVSRDAYASEFYRLRWPCWYSKKAERRSCGRGVGVARASCWRRGQT